MSSHPPLSIDPRPRFKPPTVQHIMLTQHARPVPGQAVGSVLLQTDHIRQVQLDLAAGTILPMHRATCDATVMVAAGTGQLTLRGAHPILLQPGLLVFLPAGTLHAVETETDLTLIATFMDPEPKIRFVAEAADGAR